MRESAIFAKCAQAASISEVFDLTTCQFRPGADLFLHKQKRMGWLPEPMRLKKLRTVVTD
jgi:hypothetical protein